MKRKTIINTIIIGSFVFALCLIVLLIIHFSSPRTIDQYNQLRLGSDKTQVKAIFGKSPDYVCYYQDYEIWYFAGRSFFTSSFPHDKYKSGYIFKDSGNLPDIYGHVTIAFNNENKLYAYTWIGETYTVEFNGGSIHGSHFREIPFDKQQTEQVVAPDA